MFEELPTDSVFEIAQYLDANSVISLAKTSRKNSEILQSNELWEKMYHDHWKPTNSKNNSSPIDDESTPFGINYYHLFQKRQNDYDHWKKNLVTQVMKLIQIRSLESG
jgi:hypothetical protein